MPPNGACDTHFHIFGPYDRFPLLDSRPIDLEVCSVEDVVKMQDILGISRGVIIQSVLQGEMVDHLLDAMTRYPGRFKAIAIPSSTIADAEIERLTNAGCVGARFACAYSMDVDTRLIARLHEFGWHPQFWFRGEDEALAWHQIMKSVPGNFVIDHMGWQPTEKCIDSPGFRVVLDCLETGRCWVKLSGPDRFSAYDEPPYPDVIPIARELVRRAPERMLWATDWPHGNHFKHMPNDGDLLDMMLEWVPDEATRNRILVDNPAELFGFGPA